MLVMTQVFFSCKKPSEKIKEPDTTRQKTEPAISPITGMACKFEMALQTDEFIRGIDTLKGYVWDDNNKSAYLVLNDRWELTLRRGGCDHFELSATFLYDQELEFESSREMIFDRAKWITGLIPEFDSAMIAEALDSSKFVIQAVMEGQYYINFTDERMSDYYQFEYQTWADSTKFKIGRYYE